MTDRIGIHEDDWGDIELLPAEGMLVDRRITLSVLAEELEGATRIGSLYTGYGVPLTEHVANGFAFRCTDQDYWDVLYGCVGPGDIVNQLHLTYGTPVLESALHHIGALFNLRLHDHDLDLVVDLTNRAALAAYLAADDD